MDYTDIHRLRRDKGTQFFRKHEIGKTGDQKEPKRPLCLYKKIRVMHAKE